MTKHKDYADPEREIAHLCDLPHQELVKFWQARQGAPPPKGMSRKLLLLALAYRIQAGVYGGLNPRTDRYLRYVAGGAPCSIKSVTAWAMPYIFRLRSMMTLAPAAGS